MDRLSFEEWFARLKQVAVNNGYTPEAAETFDAEAWRKFFNCNYEPESAFYEDQLAER